MINKERTKNFIKKSKEIHDNKYDYLLVDYVNNRTKVKIICKEHGIFEQTPKGHLKNQGCPKCGIIKRSLSKTKTKDEFIKQSNKFFKNVIISKNYIFLFFSLVYYLFKYLNNSRHFHSFF